MTFLTECATRDDQGMTTSAMRVTLFVAAFLSAAAPVRAVAHEEHEFEPLSEVLALQRGRPAGPMLFFALPDDFETTSPYALVPATRRPVVWIPEGTQLPEGVTAVPSLRAIGSPPPDAANARYLVPVLDTEGASLHFVPRRLEAGRLVAGEPATGANVVPVAAGPQLPVATSSSTERVLEAPVEVGAEQLTDVAPALLVRRASPSRVVFGVRLASGDYVPLVDESGVAVSARRNGRLGIAVAVPAGVDVTSVTSSDDDDGDSSPTGVGLFIVLGLLVAGAAVVVGAVVLLARFARRRLNRRGGR